MTPSFACQTPPHARHAAAERASVVALRIRTGVDADRLRDELRRSWRATGRPRHDDAACVALSIVETCGRTPAERERDALRLLDDERRATGRRGTLRATLVALGAGEHLLLLAASPGTGAPEPLSAIADDLGRRYPVTPVALA